MKYEKPILASWTVFLFFLAMPASSAFVNGSATYNITISNIDYAAYDGHSANYNIDFSLVPQYVGYNESNNYNTTYGFYGGVNYTGYSVGGPFDVSIDAPASVTVSSAATATVEMINQNPDFGEDVYLEYWIIDASGNTESSGSKTVYVGSLSTVSTTVSLTAPATTGTYTYRARITWSTIYTANASDTFTVVAAAAPSEGPSKTPSGPSISVPVLRITEYPSNITIEQGDFKYFIVEVSNIGSALASNAMLLITRLDQFWYSIEPQSDDIFAGQNESFALKFKIPDDAGIGPYNFSIKAVSGSVTHSVNSTLNIVAAEKTDIKIKDIQAFAVEQRLKANQTGKLQLIIQNNGQTNTTVTVQLAVPGSWEIDSSTITRTITAGEESIFEFTVFPGEAGTYEVVALVNYGSAEESRMIAVVVEEALFELTQEQLESLLMITGLVVICILIMTGLRFLRRKNIY